MEFALTEGTHLGNTKVAFDIIESPENTYNVESGKIKCYTVHISNTIIEKWLERAKELIPTLVRENELEIDNTDEEHERAEIENLSRDHECVKDEECIETYTNSTKCELGEEEIGSEVLVVKELPVISLHDILNIIDNDDGECKTKLSDNQASPSHRVSVLGTEECLEDLHIHSGTEFIERAINHVGENNRKEENVLEMKRGNRVTETKVKIRRRRYVRRECQREALVALQEQYTFYLDGGKYKEEGILSRSHGCTDAGKCDDGGENDDNITVPSLSLAVCEEDEILAEERKNDTSSCEKTRDELLKVQPRIAMACGSGKTVTALEFIYRVMDKNEHGGIFVVFVPSMELITQWSDNIERDMKNGVALDVALTCISHRHTKPLKWDENKHNLVVCLNNSFHRIKDVNATVCVINEAHHLLKRNNQSYNEEKVYLDLLIDYTRNFFTVRST